MHAGKHTQSPAYIETVPVPTLERPGLVLLWLAVGLQSFLLLLEILQGSFNFLGPLS